MGLLKSLKLLAKGTYNLTKGATAAGIGTAAGAGSFVRDVAGTGIGIARLPFIGFSKGGYVPMMAPKLAANGTRKMPQFSRAFQTRLVGGTIAVGTGIGMVSAARSYPQRNFKQYSAERNPDGTLEIVTPDMMGATGNLTLAMRNR